MATAHSPDDLIFDSDAASLARIAVEVNLQVNRLVLVARDAAEVQYQKSPSPKKSGDCERRALGGKSDPTYDIATDARRLGVRHEVAESIRLLTKASKLLSAETRRVEEALERWRGPE